MSAAPVRVLMTWLPEPAHLAIIERALEGDRIRVAIDREEMIDALCDAEIACVDAFDASMLASAGRLRWIHAMLGGVDALLFPELRASPIPLTCCKECFAIPAAEHALAVMLAFSRRLEYDIRQRPNRTFVYTEPEELRGKTVGIVGLGNLGSTVAGLCRCLGMRVLGTARRPRADLAGCDAVYTRDGLPAMLAESDFVVVAVPLTGETIGMIGLAEMRAMKRTSYLIDVSGRPAIYDLDSLETALRAGIIAGANVQMVPPPQSPLWDLDNLLISFHRTTSRQEVDRCYELFADNIRRFHAGMPLRGLVDKAAGY